MFVKQIWFRCSLEQAITEAGKKVRALKEDVHADFRKVVIITGRPQGTEDWP